MSLFDLHLTTEDKMGLLCKPRIYCKVTPFEAILLCVMYACYLLHCTIIYAELDTGVIAQPCQTFDCVYNFIHH